MSSTKPPPTHEYFSWLSSSMAQHEELARSLVANRAEKGRIVESVVKSALRAILPKRFELGTGFIMNSVGTSSSQMDLVIYDNFYNSPILLEGGLGLFPIECVYAFVEVKSVLDQPAITQIAQAVSAVRRMAVDKRYVGYGSLADTSGNSQVAEVHFQDDLPPRSYAFALRSKITQQDTLIAALAKATEANDTHLHGLAIMDSDLLVEQRAYTSPHAFDVRSEQVFSKFAVSVLSGIQSFQMRPAALQRYLAARAQ